jgi:hypothetical protein
MSGNGVDWASVVFLLAALILPVSALMGQRLHWKRGLVMALAWAWIFVLLVIVIKALGYG